MKHWIKLLTAFAASTVIASIAAALAVPTILTIKILLLHYWDTRMQWPPRREDGKPGKGSIAYADGHLYYRNEGGDVFLVEANPKEYVEKGRFKQPDRSKKNAWPRPSQTWRSASTPSRTNSEWVWTTELSAKSRVATTRSEGGNLARTAGELIGKTSGSLRFAFFK